MRSSWGGMNELRSLHRCSRRLVVRGTGAADRAVRIEGAVVALPIYREAVRSEDLRRQIRREAALGVQPEQILARHAPTLVGGEVVELAQACGEDARETALFVLKDAQQLRQTGALMGRQQVAMALRQRLDQLAEEGSRDAEQTTLQRRAPNHAAQHRSAPAAVRPDTREPDEH